MSVETLTVYGFSVSGNCHKVRLLLEQLRIPYRWIEVDSPNGATRTPEYLAKNPNGRVPMIERADGSVLVESNAILCWLADSFDSKGSFRPADAWRRAQALRAGHRARGLGRSALGYGASALEPAGY